MTSLHVRTQLSYNDLLKVVEQLSPSDLEKFVSQVISLRAKQKGKSFTKKETELLLKINQKIDPKVQQAYDELVSKRRAETLTLDELNQLLELTDKIEKLEARRAKYLSELAVSRHTSIPVLMKELGIHKPAYG